jgi:hypothetical protein
VARVCLRKRELSDEGGGRERKVKLNMFVCVWCGLRNKRKEKKR